MSISALQFHQLPMFLTPDDIRSMHSGDTGGPMEDWQYHTPLMHDDPRHDPDGDPGPYLEGMLRHIERKGGIEGPLHAWHGGDKPSVILDGHHRAVLGMETSRLAPVHWHEGDDHYEAAENMKRLPRSDRGPRA